MFESVFSLSFALASFSAEIFAHDLPPIVNMCECGEIERAFKC